jgi:hypothetical protein
MQPEVSKGLATWAGLVAAAGQYVAAIAVFLGDPDKATALGPLTTATVTLVVVIYGRMAQARNLAWRPPISIPPLPDEVEDEVPLIYADEPLPERSSWGDEAEELDPDPPVGPSTRIADAELDDPGYGEPGEPPTREKHSQLKG